MPLKGLTEVGKECTSTKKFPCCMSVIWDFGFFQEQMTGKTGKQWLHSANFRVASIEDDWRSTNRLEHVHG